MHNSDRPHKSNASRPPDELIGATQEQTLPYNLEAERAVLGAMLVHAPAIDEAVEFVAQDDFFRDAHRKLFATIVDLVDRKIDIDFVTLKEEVARKGLLDEVGGPAYIASLADGVPKATNVKYYAGIVADLALRRNVIYTSNKVILEAYGGEKDGRALVRFADEQFLSLEGRHTSELLPPNEAVHELFVNLEKRINNNGTLSGIDTGLTTMNEMTGGWQPGDLILVAARTSQGKTALALNAAKAAALTGARVAFFSLEMTRDAINYRLLSNTSGVMLFRILRGFLGSTEYGKISTALEVMNTLPIHIDDTPRVTMAEIRRKVRRMKASGGIGLIVVDYIQLVAGTGRRKGENRTQELEEISHRMKSLAMELRVPIIALAQLSRAPDGRSDPRPRLSDIRESGALEQDADVVVMIYRKDHKESGESEILLEKQRNGPTGTFRVTFDRETTTFTDWVKPDVPEEEPESRSFPPRKSPKKLPYS